MSLRAGLGLLGVALVAATFLSHQRYSVRRACFPLHKEVHDGSLTSAIELLLADDMVPLFIFIHRLGMILNYRRQAARYASACTHLDTFSRPSLCRLYSGRRVLCAKSLGKCRLCRWEVAMLGCKARAGGGSEAGRGGILAQKTSIRIVQRIGRLMSTRRGRGLKWIQLGRGWHILPGH